MALASPVSHQSLRPGYVQPPSDRPGDNQPGVYTVIFRRAEPELLMAESGQCSPDCFKRNRDALAFKGICIHT